MNMAPRLSNSEAAMALSPLPSSAPDRIPHFGAAQQAGDDGALSMLRRHPLFADLDVADFEQILFQLRRLSLGSRDLVYRQNSAAHHFYFVVSGRVRLYRLDATGVDRTLDSLGPGDCFAEVMIYADPAFYACYAECMSDTRVLMIPVRAYREIIGRSPVYLEKALRHFAGRAVSRFHDLEVMTVQNARERLIRYLLDLLPQGIRDACTLELPLPKYLVASRLAMQPETLSRILNDLKQRGLVRMQRGRLELPDPEGLRELCHSSSQERSRAQIS